MSCLDSMCEVDSTEEASCSRGTDCAEFMSFVVKNYYGGSMAD